MSNADQLVACFLYFYSAVARIMLPRLRHSSWFVSRSCFDISSLRYQMCCLYATRLRNPIRPILILTAPNTCKSENARSLQASEYVCALGRELWNMVSCGHILPWGLLLAVCGINWGSPAVISMVPSIIPTNLYHRDMVLVPETLKFSEKAAQLSLLPDPRKLRLRQNLKRMECDAAGFAWWQKQGPRFRIDFLYSQYQLRQCSCLR